MNKQKAINSNGTPEEAARAFAADKMECRNRQLEEGDLIAAFRAGASWQRVKDRKGKRKSVPPRIDSGFGYQGTNDFGNQELDNRFGGLQGGW